LHVSGIKHRSAFYWSTFGLIIKKILTGNARAARGIIFELKK